MATKEKISYSEAVAEIESILAQIENDELDVDELSENVKKISVLVKDCREKLTKTKEDVENLFKEIS